MARRLPARELIESLVDQPRQLEGPAESSDPLGWPDYASRLQECREETDVDEAVVTVRGRVTGSDVEAVFAVWEFGFMGGSMGMVVGERVARAYETAAEARLPVVLLPATGGARMQEGMASLAQLAKTAVAAQAHAETGLLQVAVLRDPTTGGVFASHVNLADVILAEPEATIGFAGPRVAEAMTRGPLPEGSHTSEGARAAGLVDAVVPREELRERLASLLRWPGPAGGGHGPEGAQVPEGERTEPGDAWTQVQRAREENRPRTRAFLDAWEVAFELHGDRAGDDDPAVRVALARVAGRPAVVVGLDREGEGGRVTPAGYRLAWRGLRLASRLGVPVVTLVDTPGADAGASSEAGGVAHHIAQTFREMLAVRSPVVSLVIGEGGSGGALCLSVGDRLLIQEHAIFTVLGIEGAAALLRRDESEAPEVARLLQPTATKLKELGIGDEVVPEPRGHAVEAASAVIARHLDELAAQPDDERLALRRRRWRSVGRNEAWDASSR